MLPRSHEDSSLDSSSSHTPLERQAYGQIVGRAISEFDVQIAFSPSDWSNALIDLCDSLNTLSCNKILLADLMLLFIAVFRRL